MLYFNVWLLLEIRSFSFLSFVTKRKKWNKERNDIVHHSC